MLKFPYGVSDFHLVSTGGYFYVDRTNRIPLLEEAGNQLLFIRPRRFGKSLLLSMLENYYDLARTDQFEAVFGHLAIGQNPTPMHNRYFVMTWDLSTVEASGDGQALRRSLYDHINDQIQTFALYYRHHLPTSIVINPDNALSSFAALLRAVQQTPYKLYLLIDEYDNFANEVLMSSIHEGRKRYEEIVKGEGFLKTVFKMIKSASRGQGLERVFITGVSPMVMSDMSSGYNVAENIYLDARFHDLCGFTEEEITDVLQQVDRGGLVSEEKRREALEMMRTYYNGYRFSLRNASKVYNPTLVLYFLKALQNNSEYPTEMLDDNMAMDRSRIAYIAQLGGTEEVVLQALDENEPLVSSTLAQRFGVAEIMSGHDKSKEYLASLLYYFGVLTLDGRSLLQKYLFAVPNLVIRRLYAERLYEFFLPEGRQQDESHRLIDHFFLSGDLRPLCQFVEQRIFRAFDNRDYVAMNELSVKTAFLSLLFNDKLYLVDSETAIQRTYADLTLILRPDLRHQQQLTDFILEFKYVRLNEVNLSGIAARQLSFAELQALPAIQTQLAQARTQLQTYRRDLQIHYGNTLRLRTYAVVALGFERVVWEEV